MRRRAVVGSIPSGIAVLFQYQFQMPTKQLILGTTNTNSKSYASIPTSKRGVRVKRRSISNGSKNQHIFPMEICHKKSELEGRKENEITGPSAERREAASR